MQEKREKENKLAKFQSILLRFELHNISGRISWGNTITECRKGSDENLHTPHIYINIYNPGEWEILDNDDTEEHEDMVGVWEVGKCIKEKMWGRDVDWFVGAEYVKSCYMWMEKRPGASRYDTVAQSQEDKIGECGSKYSAWNGNARKIKIKRTLFYKYI